MTTTKTKTAVKKFVRELKALRTTGRTTARELNHCRCRCGCGR